jgi:HSP20 family molecular chaperone IbpA
LEKQAFGGTGPVFLRFDLPEAINLDKVTADLNKGVLHLTAAKAKQEAASELKSAKPIAA